ncbi:hypothetical protein J6590_099764 [Homalodisca vitripennis]|nr:hypothetical protein J6590_099764 [Homalodisca vitripennis]
MPIEPEIATIRLSCTQSDIVNAERQQLGLDGDLFNVRVLSIISTANTLENTLSTDTYVSCSDFTGPVSGIAVIHPRHNTQYHSFPCSTDNPLNPCTLKHTQSNI